MDIWAKILTDEKRGQVLVTTGYDSDENKDIVSIEFRGRAAITMSLHFPDEAKQRAAFDMITQDNIAEVIANSGVILDKIRG